MTLWNLHTEFSTEFLARYHEYVLYDCWHQIVALLLYPPCRCSGHCRCVSLRTSIKLTLNTNLYNQAETAQEHAKLLSALRCLLNIPEDRFFRQHHADVYPLGFIEETWHSKVTHFKAVAQLVWTLLRLAKTYESLIFNMPQASLKEAIEIIVGKMPLKTKSSAQPASPLCGEKAYSRHFRTYKGVCHFIAALQKPDKENCTFITPNTIGPAQLTELLSLAHWVGNKLLAIKTPNVKDNAFLTADNLVPLPLWVNSSNVSITLDPFPDKLQEYRELWAKAQVS